MRRDIDPAAMPPRLLPHMQLIDVERTPRLRYRWRLMGTHITEIMARDSTGRYWDELYDGQAMTIVSAAADWVLEHRRPIRTTGATPLREKSFLRTESVDTPPSRDGVQIDMVWELTVFAPAQSG